MAKKKSKQAANTIAVNKKARHDFIIEKEMEAGIALQGWELKSIRAGKAQLRDTYVLFEHGEAYLYGAVITPLTSASTHIVAEPQRYRKLLLHRQEIRNLMGTVERKGYTVVALSLYWLRGKVKCKIALAKGKHLYDKRAALKERDWKREKERLHKRR